MLEIKITEEVSDPNENVWRKKIKLWVTLLLDPKAKLKTNHYLI